MADEQTTAARKPKANMRDLRAVVIGVARRLPILLVLTGVGVPAARILSKRLARQTYSALTIIRYKPWTGTAAENDYKGVVLTLRDTIKISEHLTEVQRRLGGKIPLGEISKAIDAQVQKNTTLMLIEATWKNAQGAADLANITRDVFIEHCRDADRMDGDRRMASLRERLAAVQSEMATADAVLRQFTSRNSIIDLEKQSRALLDEANSYGVLLEQADADRKTVIEQAAQVDRVVEELRRKVESESKALQDTQAVSDVRSRMDELKERIREDRGKRVSVEELRLREQEAARYRKLRDLGAVSEADYQRALTALEKARIDVVDTEQTTKWKEELDRLKATVMPPVAGEAPSAQMLREAMGRSLDIQLRKVAVDQRVASLRGSRARVNRLIERLPDQQRQYDALQRGVGGLESERKDLQERLAVAERNQLLSGLDFQLVAAAVPPAKPMKSTGKMILLGTLLGSVGLGLILTLLPELLDTTVRTAREAAARTGLPVLGVIGRCRARLASGELPEVRVSDSFTMAARRLRQALPDPGVRILITAATRGEGVSSVALALASSMGRQGEQVLLIDAADRVGPYVQRFLGEAPGVPGLIDYLDGQADADALLGAAPVEGVTVVSRLGRATPSDRFASVRMGELLEEASRRFAVIIVESSPAGLSIEAEILAQVTDAAVVVIRSKGPGRAAIRRALDRLQGSSPLMAGVILNRVGWSCMRSDA